MIDKPSIEYAEQSLRTALRRIADTRMAMRETGGDDRHSLRRATILMHEALSEVQAAERAITAVIHGLKS